MNIPEWKAHARLKRVKKVCKNCGGTNMIVFDDGERCLHCAALFDKQEKLK